MALIEASNLTKNFYLGKTLIQALRGVDFEIKAEEFVAIAGPSGSGKTTLLNLLGCIDVPSSGTLKMDGQDVTHLSSDELADLRHTKLGFIFQTFNLIPVLSAFENVEYSLLKRKMSARERRDRVMDSLKEVGLLDQVNHKPEELSGGQRQRVAIARALVREPEIILADEPTANLDHQTGTRILEIMKRINEERKTVFIFSTHDPKIMETAGRIIYIMDGQIVPSGELNMELPLNVRLAFRNIFRNRVRSSITLAAISFGSISLILAGGFFQDTFLRMREAYIHAHLGHIQVYQKGYLAKGNSRPFDYLIKAPEDVQKLIASLDHVKYVTPRINFSALLSTGENTMSVMAQGIDPEGENAINVITDIKGVSTSLDFSKGQGLSKNDMYEVNLGRGLAKGIDIGLGSPLILLSNTIGGSLNGMDVNVKGIFYTASEEYDNYTMRIPISLARKLLQTDAAQSLVVVLDKTENTDLVYQRLTELFREKNLNLEMKPWYEMADFYNKTVDLYGRQFLVLEIIIAVIVILSIFNTISMSIWERTKEIGTIMAMGFKKWEIMRLFLLEGCVLGVMGGILGAVGGCVLAYIISIVGIPMPPPPGATTAWTASIQIVPSVILTSIVLSIVASLISSFYPSYKASRLIIADALRYA